MGKAVNSGLAGTSVTGSRRLDIALLTGFVAVLIATSPWLRVYHRITAFEMKLVRVDEGGQRQPLPLPPELELRWLWNRKPSVLLPTIERAFQMFVARRKSELGPSDVAYELTVSYSYNSPDLDQSVVWSAR